MATEGKSRDFNHEIDQRAEAILMINVPPAWIPNPMRKDYGKDILFELIDEETRFLKGTSFYVQLKGKKKAAIRDKGRYVSCSLEVPNIKDWCDKSPLPVFVVAVDITKEKGVVAIHSGTHGQCSRWMETASDILGQYSD